MENQEVAFVLEELTKLKDFTRRKAIDMQVKHGMFTNEAFRYYGKEAAFEESFNILLSALNKSQSKKGETRR